MYKAQNSQWEAKPNKAQTIPTTQDNYQGLGINLICEISGLVNTTLNKSSRQNETAMCSEMSSGMPGLLWPRSKVQVDSDDNTDRYCFSQALCQLSYHLPIHSSRCFPQLFLSLILTPAWPGLQLLPHNQSLARWLIVQCAGRDQSFHQGKRHHWAV